MPHGKPIKKQQKKTSPSHGSLKCITEFSDGKQNAEHYLEHKTLELPTREDQGSRPHGAA